MSETNWPKFEALYFMAHPDGDWHVRVCGPWGCGVAFRLTEAQAREMAETLNLAREARELAEAFVNDGLSHQVAACDAYLAAKAALEATS